MDTTQSRQISVIEPIGAAIEKTKQVLFRPFDIAKWFAIGFCAWLAALGSGGNLNFNFGNWGSREQYPDFQQGIHNAKEAVLENLPMVIRIGTLAILIIVVLLLVFMWIRSRGQFMFFNCVAQNKGEVVAPWKQYAQQANSLFLFRLALGLAGFVVSILFIVPLVVIGISFLNTGLAGFALANVVWGFLLVFCIIMVVMTLSGIKLLTDDFVVPIMSLRRCTVTEGWKEFWSLLMANKGPFTLYLLFLFVIGLAIGMIVLTAVLVTCCCAACFLMIPYIGTVLMLPILVWRRAYSLFYLAQFGPQFDAFQNTPDPVVVPTASIPPIPPEQNP
ncbi:MAG: hypothetical protein B6I25_01525 [Planctomycetales bacterium 4572_13]|nr:MAG: hypothetical protein B6I25_01525 [Planctomycetales bacterium 4572_13]